MLNDEFQLAPLPPDADTAEMLEAIGPLEERPAEAQYCVFRSGRERFFLPVLDVEEVLEWPIDQAAPRPRLRDGHLQPARGHRAADRHRHDRRAPGARG